MLVISNESEVFSEAIYMLLSARKLLLILTPPLTLLATLAIVQLIHYNQQQQQQQQLRNETSQRHHQHQNHKQSAARQQVAGGRSRGNISSSASAIILPIASLSHQNQHQQQLERSQAPIDKEQRQESSIVKQIIPQTAIRITTAPNESLEEDLRVDNSTSLDRRRPSRQEPQTVLPMATITSTTTTTTAQSEASSASSSTKVMQTVHLSSQSPAVQPQQQDQQQGTKRAKKRKSKVSLAKIKINLDKGNYALQSRCIGRPVSMRFCEEHRKYELGLHLQDLATKQEMLMTKRKVMGLDLARSKIVSTIMTIETLKRERATRETGCCAIQQPTTTLVPPGGGGDDDQQQSDDLLKSKANSKTPSPSSSSSSSSASASSQASAPLLVRLRANLTQLYICFDERGKLVPRVNGSAPNCLFDEHRIDAQFVKYQSVLNSSWLIGFDMNGNPVEGKEEFARDGSPEAIKRERCYHFKKENRLDVPGFYFPDAEKILAGRRGSPKPMSNLEASIRENLRNPQNRMQLQVHSFTQRQLINMNRYRNIQKYQFNKALKEIQQMNNNNNNSTTTTSQIGADVSYRRGNTNNNNDEDNGNENYHNKGRAVSS